MMKAKIEGCTYLRSASYHTFGWLRRPEMDNELTGYCYVHPDGTQIFTCDPHHRFTLTLDVWVDDEAQELFCTISEEIEDKRSRWI